jgi:hypothetical protein
MGLVILYSTYQFPLGAIWVRVATGPRDRAKISADILNQIAVTSGRQGQSLRNKVVHCRHLIPFLPHSPLHILFIHLITDLFAIPWLLVLVTRSLTLEILLPTPQCHSHILNSISNAGVSMMRNQTSATHIVREMQVQHILPPTLPTTTLASTTPTVSITHHPFLLCSRLSQLELFPFLFSMLSNFFLSFRHLDLTSSPRSSFIFTRFLSGFATRVSSYLCSVIDSDDGYAQSVSSHTSVTTRPGLTSYADPYPAWSADKQIPISYEEIEDIFLDLTQKFGFQRDSMRNQVCLFMSRSARAITDIAF